jgi:hypothetical protein
MHFFDQQFNDMGNYSGRYQIVSDNPQQCKRHQA